MSQRINITVSDDLFQRLQEVKENLNVSRVCQDAIASAVKIEEIKKKAIGDDMEENIERLRAEKEVWDKNYNLEGFEEGYEAAKNFSYETLVEIVKDEYTTTNRVWGIIDPSPVSLEEKNKDDPAFDEDSYIEGFIEGVEVFWNELKKKI